MHDKLFSALAGTALSLVLCVGAYAAVHKRHNPPKPFVWGMLDRPEMVEVFVPTQPFCTKDNPWGMRYLRDRRIRCGLRDFARTEQQNCSIEEDI